jgi:hypothetical protein
MGPQSFKEVSDIRFARFVVIQTKNADRNRLLFVFALFSFVQFSLSLLFGDDSQRHERLDRGDMDKSLACDTCLWSVYQLTRKYS